MSTIAVPAVQRLDEPTRKAGGVLLDAPVLGGQVSVREGALLVMVGGDEIAYERAKAYLTAIGPRVFRVGDVGQAKTMNALNLSLATQMLALGEGLLLAVKGGLDRDIALEVMLGGAIASPMAEVSCAARQAAAGESVVRLHDDAEGPRPRARAREKLGVPLPTPAVSNQWLNVARGQGLERHDFAVLYYALAHAAGLELPLPVEAAPIRDRRGRLTRRERPHGSPVGRRASSASRGSWPRL